MNQQVADSLVRSRNAPPPAPPDPDAKRFWRIRVNADIDTDQDGSPDWAEYEIASRGTGILLPGVVADPFDADSNHDFIPDGDQLDADLDGTPDAKDPDAADNSATVPIGPLPRYALFPFAVPQYETEPNYRPIEINDLGTVLCPYDTWTAGVWTPLELTDGDIYDARAFGINDLGEIVGTCTRPQSDPNFPVVPQPGNMAYWDQPDGVPSLIKQGEDHAWSSRFFGIENYYQGSMFSNDGSVPAYSDKVVNGFLEGRDQNYIWTLAGHNRVPGKTAVAEGYLQLADKDHYWGPVGTGNNPVWTLRA